MSIEDRLASLEHRLGVIEELVRRGLLPGQSAAAAAAVLPRSVPNPTPPVTPTPVTPARSGNLSAEQWFGQRGVLGVGVFLLILAGAYFLKVAIDRGWISPVARCIVAILVGHAVAAMGWRAYRRGTETYGASLIGAGSGIIYLGIWAASRWYSLVSLELGIVGLAVIAIATYAVAHRLEIEALGFAAALGALLGPIVIGSNDPSANALLLYLGGVGVTLGVAAVRRQWRLTTLLIVATSLLLALPAASRAKAILAFAFAVTGGLAALWLRRRWVEVGLIGFLGAGGMLLLITAPSGASWLIIAGGVLLAAPIWWSELYGNITWPDGGVFGSAKPWSPSESFFFYLVPLLIAATIATAYGQWTTAHPGAIALLVAVPYLVVGYLPIAAWQRSRPAFALVGTTAAGLAAFNWPGLGIGTVLTLLGLTLLWAAIDHLQRRADGRWYALLALGGAAMRFGDIVRAPGGAAFVDLWAITFWMIIAVIAALAMGLWRVVAAGYQELVVSRVPAILWLTAGGLLFAGVTHELIRLVGQLGFTPVVVLLASGLAVSTWWALFAGGLVVFGFYRKLTPVRIAGLLVAGLAVVKVLFFDLANLDQLYRVGSFIILAVVLLLVAYLYHRQAMNSYDEPLPEPAEAEKDV